MLFNYELKKIWRRVSPLMVVIILGLTTIATMVLTLIFFHQAPTQTTNTEDVSANYAKLENKILNWNPTERSNFKAAFDEFFNKYQILNDSTITNQDQLRLNYTQAKTAFDYFFNEYYLTYITDQTVNDYLLVRSKYFDSFAKIIEQLDAYFLADYTDNEAITNGLSQPNEACENASLQELLTNLFYVQKIGDEDLAELQAFFQQQPAGKANHDYHDAYEYATNRYWLAVAKASTEAGDLSQYKGFENYQGVKPSTRVCELTKYRLDHANIDFAAPYQFGNIYNHSSRVSLFDFVFTNMEMAMLPLTLLVMIWAACTFFTDHYQSTLITPIAAGKKRATIIFTKTAVVIMLMAAAVLLMTGIYIVSGLLFFHAYVSPDILFLLNGTKATTMSAVNYFAVYFLNLIFKLLPLIAVCGLFSFVKNKPFVIVAFTTLICVAVVTANALLGGFAFYQYVPLMGLDPLRYFGASMLLAPMPTDYNLWYAFPAMAVITLLLYVALIHTFRRHDF